MSAHAIDLLRRAHASLEAVREHLHGAVGHLQDTHEGSETSRLRANLGDSLSALASIAGRVLMRTPVEPPRLSAECVRFPEGPLEVMNRTLRERAEAEYLARIANIGAGGLKVSELEDEPADLEDVEARTEALLPSAWTLPPRCKDGCGNFCCLPLPDKEARTEALLPPATVHGQADAPCYCNGCKSFRAEALRAKCEVTL